MYVVKVYVSGDAEAVKVPDQEYAQDFIRENVSGAAEQCVRNYALKSYPGYLSIMHTKKANGLRAKPNQIADRLTGWKTVGNALILPGINVRRTKGFTLEEAAAIIDELQGAGHDDE